MGHDGGGNSRRNDKNHKIVKPMEIAPEFSLLKTFFPGLTLCFVSITNEVVMVLMGYLIFKKFCVYPKLLP